MKKITSLFLVAVMIFALIPSVFAEGGDGEVTEYVYDLGYDMYNNSNNIELGYENTSNKWSYYTKYGDGIISKRYRVGSGYPYDEYLRITDGSWYAAKIKIPEAGTYTPTIIAFKNTDTSSEAKIYLIDKATAEALAALPNANSYEAFADKENSGVLNGKAATKEGHGTITGNAMTFTEGENYIVFYNPEVSNDANYFYIASLTLTKAEESPEYVSAFTPSDTVEGSIPAKADVLPLAYATDGENIAPANIKATDNENGTYTVTTDAEVNGYTFRYWAKGLQSKDRKRIVSFANEFTYTPSNENNYLIAVYDKAGTTAAATEYYNANGQLIPEADDTTKVYMAGYGEASGWKEPVYGIKEAIYGEPIKYDITIGDAEPVKFAWGDPVPCVAEDQEGYVFWGWKKTVNNVDAGIVSTDKNYTFYAWESCTVTPVYKETAPVFDSDKRRIILGTFTLGGKNAVMAEFFGFDEALERGITIDGTDYAMTNKKVDQFTIVDDDNKGNISGYAILADGVKLIYNLK